MPGQHGGSIIGQRLAHHGVSCLFTLCGGHISPILTGAEDHGLRVIDVRDEVSAVFAADAMARMTGIPGVAAVTAGPGVTNTITAVKNAQMAESPLIVFGGATATILKGRGSLQDIDQLAIMKPITKWATSISTISSIAPTVDKAFAIAQSGVPGPVFIEVPVDLLYPEETVRDWFMKESGADKAKGLGGRALKLYLEGHLYRQFKAPHIPNPFSDAPSSTTRNPQNTARKVSHAAKLLQKAKKPVLVLGSQTLVNCTPQRAEAIAEAVRSLGIPTFLGGTARGMLGRKNDIQFRHKRSAALREADVILIAGFPFDFRLGYGQKINRKGTLIAVNLSPEGLRKNRKPDLAVEMHPGDFLLSLAAAFTNKASGLGDWYATLRKREDERDNEIQQQGEESAEDPTAFVNPLKLFLHIEEKMADDSVVIVDGGDFVATGSYIVRPRKPLSWLDPGVFGTLGVGGGFALGATLARPDAEVWLFYGDGSSAYSLAEFDTCVRQGLAPIAVIGTDGSWAQIARDQIEILGTDLGTVLLRNPYHTVAEGYGGKGLLLTDESKIDEVLEEAKAIAAEGKPVAINVHIAKSDFRKGSLSM